MNEYYYIAENNQPQGPVSWKQLQDLNLPGSSYVWREGLPNWVRLDSLKEKKPSSYCFFRNMSIIRILLLIFSIGATLLMLLIGKYLYSFITYCIKTDLNDTWIIFLTIALVMIIPFLFIKKRRYLVHAFLTQLPLICLGTVWGCYYQHSYDSFEDDYCVFSNSEGTGVINKWGIKCIQPVYSFVTLKKENGLINRCWVIKDDNNGICDMQGYEIIPCTWSYLVYKDQYHFYIVGNEGTYGILNKDGSVLLPCKYDKLRRWSPNEVFYEVKNGDYFGLFDPKICTMILDCSYIRTKFYDNGVCKLNMGGYTDNHHNIKGGLWGALNKKGEIIVPTEYDKISFSYNHINAYRGNIMYQYDTSGRLLNIY